MKESNRLEQEIHEKSVRTELSEAKPDEHDLPYFSKEVPVSSSKRQNRDMTTVTYNWKNLYETSLKVKEITYESNAGLDGFYKVAAKDGIEKTAVNLNGKAYVLRKVMKSVAKTAYETAKKAVGVVERIVGYLQTVVGNFYTISLLERVAWVFDKSLKTNGIKLLDKESIGENGKKRLFEGVCEQLSALHSKNLVLGTFSLDNLIIYDNTVRFSDLRMLKESRKRSSLVDEFRTAVSTMLSEGFCASCDVAYAARYYLTENPAACKEWFKEEMKREAKDEEEIACVLEQIN